MCELILVDEIQQVVLMHYDLFHRASRTRPNSFGNVRFMIKLQFARTQAPTAGGSVRLASERYPDTWSDSTTSGANEAVSMRHRLWPAWKSVHDWLSNDARHAKETTIYQIKKCIQELRCDCQHGDENAGLSEPQRVYCAYTLGRYAKFASSTPLEASEAMESLAFGLTNGTEEIRRVSMYGLSAAGSRAIPMLLQILSEPGTEPSVKAVACHASGELQTETAVRSTNLLRAVVRAADEALLVSPCTRVKQTRHPCGFTVPSATCEYSNSLLLLSFVWNEPGDERQPERRGMA